ncbi:MAG: 3'-5' exonuclease [Ignavibacteriales bacterium]|nr:3'-5' exonuclease [Ignavibacteriales bacterium]
MPSPLIEASDFVVVDVETTGMHPVNDRVTEIAMFRVRNGQITDEFSTLVNPLMTIPAFITDMTGIDNVMVADAPTAREVSPYVAEFLAESVFVAHNVGFDWGFVKEMLRRERNIELSAPRLCTVKLSQRILSTLPSKSLGPVTRALGITIPHRHRASGDAYATAQVLIQFLRYLEDRLALTTLEEVLRFQYKSSPLLTDQP